MARRLPTELKRDHNSAFVRWKGEKIYFGTWGSQESFVAFAEWLQKQLPDELQAADVKVPAVAPPHEIIIEICVLLYLKHARKYYAKDGEPTQEFVNVRSAMNILLEHSGKRRAIDFGPKRLKKLMEQLAKQKVDDAAVEPVSRTSRGLPKVSRNSDNRRYARTTINSIADRICRCFKWCASEELIPAEIVTALDTVPGLPLGRDMARESEPVTSVSFSVVLATLPYLSPTSSAMVEVQALCGMRPQDVCGMTTRAIDQSGDVWLYRPSQHKGSHLGRLLTKAIPPIAQQILLPLLREDLDEPIFSPIDSKAYFRDLQHPVRVITPERALVALHLQRQGKLLPEIAAELGCSRSSASALIQMGKEASGARKRKRSRSALKKSAAKGHQRTFYTTASYGKSIRYAIQRAAKVGESIPHWAPNQLRHSVATRLRSTSGIEAAQIYLGHSEPDTTLIYAEQTEEALIEIARDFALPLGEHRRPKHESH